MANLIDSYQMANNPIFINRVSQALAQHCEVVRLEAPATPNHERRWLLMLQVMADVNARAYQFARMVVGNASVAAKAPDQADVPDGDITYVIAEQWNAFTDLYLGVVMLPPAPVEP